MNIVIICDQTDCIHNHKEQTIGNICLHTTGIVTMTNPEDKLDIQCLAKDIFYHQFGESKLGIDTTTRENIQKVLSNL